MKSSGISTKTEAQISFKVSVGVSKSSDHSTKQQSEYNNKSRKEVIECFGGKTENCPPAGSWSAWSQTVAEQPYPVKYNLETLDQFLEGYKLERTYVDSPEEKF